VRLWRKVRTPISARAWNGHLRRGWSIAHSSASPAFRVTARETHFGLLRLDPICETAFELDRRWRIEVAAPS
jgi:phosphopentomutase